MEAFSNRGIQPELGCLQYLVGSSTYSLSLRGFHVSSSSKDGRMSLSDQSSPSPSNIRPSSTLRISDHSRSFPFKTYLPTNFYPNNFAYPPPKVTTPRESLFYASVPALYSCSRVTLLFLTTYDPRGSRPP